MAAFALGVLEVCRNRATIPANPDKSDTIDRWDLLILRKLLIAGMWSGNPAYRLARHYSFFCKSESPPDLSELTPLWRAACRAKRTAFVILAPCLHPPRLESQRSAVGIQ